MNQQKTNSNKTILLTKAKNHQLHILSIKKLSKSTKKSKPRFWRRKSIKSLNMLLHKEFKMIIEQIKKSKKHILQKLQNFLNLFKVNLTPMGAMLTRYMMMNQNTRKKVMAMSLQTLSSQAFRQILLTTVKLQAMKTNLHRTMISWQLQITKVVGKGSKITHKRKQKMLNSLSLIIQ